MPACSLCPIQCDLDEGEAGFCQVRVGASGTPFGSRLVTFGHVSTASVGPIEQKPIFHFMPGSKVLSLGSNGCNMACGYCQNFEISQVGKKSGKCLSPSEAISMAVEKGVQGVAFTFSEPLVWYEYVASVASERWKHNGLFAMLKTNGLCNAFDDMASMMDAINIDVKGGPRSYREVCGLGQDGMFEHVLKNASKASAKAHLEISLMIIPGYEDELGDVVSGLRGAVPRGTPIHVLRFVPDFKMRSVPPTSLDAMRSAEEALRKHFDRVYLGYSGARNDTLCDCGTVLASRTGLALTSGPSGASCPSCGKPHDIIMS